MQLRFKDTAHLPMNLWKAFSRFDADGSGRIERDEFSHVSAIASGVRSVPENKIIVGKSQCSGRGLPLAIGYSPGVSAACLLGRFI
jgi:hypothetical protein